MSNPYPRNWLRYRRGGKYPFPFYSPYSAGPGKDLHRTCDGASLPTGKGLQVAAPPGRLHVHGPTRAPINHCLRPSCPVVQWLAGPVSYWPPLPMIISSGANPQQRSAPPDGPDPPICLWYQASLPCHPQSYAYPLLAMEGPCQFRPVQSRSLKFPCPGQPGQSTQSLISFSLLPPKAKTFSGR